MLSGLEVRQRDVVGTVPEAPHLSPLLRRIVAARGINKAEKLSLSLADLPAFTLPDEAKAVSLLLQSLQQNEAIVIVGDYDADGATATALLYRALTAFGFSRVSYFVPDRFVYGYGLSPAIVRAVHEQGPVDLIITVDNGITSVEGVALAQAQGVKVLVTDHHLPGTQLPTAEALVNPRLEPHRPGQHLAGVGVVFYLLAALRRELRAQGHPGGEVNISQWLDLVAVGTVADVVRLDHINRILVEQGLRRIRSGNTLPGIKALLTVAGREPQQLCAQDLGFVVAPRLNAAGRLSDMAQGIRCLLADSEAQAREDAEALDAINRQRRHIEQGMREEALAQVERWQQQQLPAVACLYESHWHEGVVGIVAARVREAIHRPVFAFAPAQQAGLVKGSGRSIKGLHLKDLLERVAALRPGLLQAFGGHAMAAGVTLPKTALSEFSHALQVAMAEVATEALFQPIIETDGELQENEINLALAEEVRFAFPWGTGFEPPTFDGEFEVLNHRVVGEKHLKLTLGLPRRSGVVDAIYFNPPEAYLSGGFHRIYGVYRLEVNEWQNRRNVQLLFEYLQPR